VLLPTAASIFLVILAQSAATSRAYAAKYSEPVNENIDLIGLSFANAAAGVSGTFVVNGSPTKTQMVDGAGGKSQISQLSTAVIVLIVLLFLTVPLSYMPNAVLASIVFLIGVELVDIAGMRKILRWRVDEFAIATITAVVVVTLGVEQGIILAIILSIIDHLRISYHPRDTYVVPTITGRTSVPVDAVTPPAEAATGLVIYRFGASLYYANANRFVEEIRAIVASDVGLRTICLDAGGIGDVDYTGGESLAGLVAELREHDVALVLADVSDDVKARLSRYGFVDLIGEDAFYEGLGDVLRGAPEAGG
jgi:MFS superfamily sulfate permease-like transporter